MRHVAYLVASGTADFSPPLSSLSSVGSVLRNAKPSSRRWRQSRLTALLEPPVHGTAARRRRKRIRLRLRDAPLCEPVSHGTIPGGVLRYPIRVADETGKRSMSAEHYDIVIELRGAGSPRTPRELLSYQRHESPSAAHVHTHPGNAQRVVTNAHINDTRGKMLPSVAGHSSNRMLQGGFTAPIQRHVSRRCLDDHVTSRVAECKADLRLLERVQKAAHRVQSLHQWMLGMPEAVGWRIHLLQRLDEAHSTALRIDQ